MEHITTIRKRYFCDMVHLNKIFKKEWNEISTRIFDQKVNSN